VAKELLPFLEKTKELSAEDREKQFQTDLLAKTANTLPLKGDRTDGLQTIVGKDMLEKLQKAKIFMVGAGAIGCELLKNYAMLGIGSAAPGSIVLTDPDHIEKSNLTRQFLFRKKHITKPKASTAAAQAIAMNPDLKGRVVARLEKVHDGTKHIFHDQFFRDLDCVTNALDNIAARMYVDSRCVANKKALLESGTLGPKGHVQVIIPHMTESYASMKDPEDNNAIPVCTLKMFPEETIHCVEWARDLFGKLFTSDPKSAVKCLEEGPNANPVSAEDVQAFREGVNLLDLRPKTFDDCVQFARE
jgi:molybdopterin/thiamine biosynthesis adenylyltransferase